MSKKTGQPAGGRLLRKPRAPAKKPESSNVDTQDTVIIQGYTGKIISINHCVSRLKLNLMTACTTKLFC